MSGTTGSGRGSFESLGEGQMRRASHAPRHIVDLSSSTQQSQQQHGESGQSSSSSFQGMANYSGFSDTNYHQQNNFQDYSYMNSTDPRQPLPLSATQGFYHSRSDPPSFIQMPQNTSDMRQQSFGGNNVSDGGGGSQQPTYQVKHRDSRDSRGSTSSISPAMLNRLDGSNMNQLQQQQQQYNPTCQTNVILGSPRSIASLPTSDRDRDRDRDTDQYMAPSRSNSDGGAGRYLQEGSREISPVRRPSHGAGTSSRHPYMDDYARRQSHHHQHQHVNSNNTSPTASPLPGFNKRSSNATKGGAAGKRSSLDQGPNRMVSSSGHGMGGGGDDSDEEDNANDIPEGVEKDGMMWGMKTEDYRALSARERKRVRNRISARTFRARRKGELVIWQDGVGKIDAHVCCSLLI